MSKNVPVHEVKVGRVRAAVWTHESEGKTWHSVSFSRLYKDREGKWQDGGSFSRDDLPLLLKAAYESWSWMYQRPEEGVGDE